MPGVSAPALVDAFQPGDAGVLLSSMGHGTELSILLKRLAPHQSVMVVEPEPWKTALALRLHDFRHALSRRHLLIFTGIAAWDDLREFLLENTGFLEPQRILSWPWFDAAQIGEITPRVSSINQAVNHRRADLLSASRQTMSTKGRISTEPSTRLAVLSSFPTPQAIRLSRVLTASAKLLNWDSIRLVRDDPARAHPTAMAEAMGDFHPTLTIVIDSQPEPSDSPQADPSNFSQDGSVCVLSQTGMPINSSTSVLLRNGARLIVPNDRARETALKSGLDSIAILVIPPAAQSGLGGRPPSASRRLAVFANAIDATALSAGLHLATHVRIWDVAVDLIRATVDTYTDECATSIVQDAENKLKIRLESAEVRDGIADRIRTRLGPQLVREAYLGAIAQSELPFDLYGIGWPNHPTLSAHCRGPWPDPESLGEALRNHNAIILIESCEPSIANMEYSNPLLDSLAAGLLVFSRTKTNHHPTHGDQVILDPRTLCHGYTSRADLIRQLSSCQTDPLTLDKSASRASEFVRSNHTWAHRLQLIEQSCR